MMLSRRPIRFFAAALAVLGLFARPLQAAVDCPMPTMETTETTETTQTLARVASDPHAGHHEHGVSAGPQRQGATAGAPGGALPAADALASEPAQPPSPSGERCPDLAHCAVAAPAAEREVAACATRTADDRADVAQDRPASTVASLEPPPPKRG